jgi:formiminoglutamase
MTMIEVESGHSPIILAFPHTGTQVPTDVAARLNPNGLLLADTDWHIHDLYRGLLPSVTTVRTTIHRYVIDAGRNPSGESLYPGQNTTGLVPMHDFDGVPIWCDGQEPDEADTTSRLAAFHAPYHVALLAEIERVKAEHGVAVVFDCHSIRSHIPFLFEGKLPDLNIGTDGGKTCHPAIERAAVDVAANAPGYSSVLNGRFKGGWTSRHYGRPETGVHGIQLELAQSTYLTSEVPPFAYDADKANSLRGTLQTLLARIETVALGLK